MGAAIAITRTGHSAAELRAIAGKCRDGEQVRRLLAIAMVLEGVRRVEAAERDGMDRQTLRGWVHRCNDAGIEGLKSRRGPGPTPMLTAAQKAALKALVIAGPDPAVHQVVRWRCVDLREEVARRFGVTAHVSTIGKWLHELGLTRLQPRPCHPGKDAAAEAAFEETSPAWWRRRCPSEPAEGFSRSGSRTKPGSARRADTPTFGRPLARGRSWCATIDMIRPTRPARSARPAPSAPPSSCRA